MLYENHLEIRLEILRFASMLMIFELPKAKSRVLYLVV